MYQNSLIIFNALSNAVNFMLTKGERFLEIGIRKDTIKQGSSCMN